jgi:hypothetical protein
MIEYPEEFLKSSSECHNQRIETDTIVLDNFYG